MLPHPTLVHRENEIYVLIGHGNLQVRVTKENWNTLRFNIKTWNPEYFPASYLRPIPTVLSEDGASSTAKFPRSTIKGTLEKFRLLLLAPVLQKSKKISPEVYRALSLNSPSEADIASDRATAPKRIPRLRDQAKIDFPTQILFAIPSKQSSTCRGSIPSHQIPKTQVHLPVTPAVMRRTRLTPPSPPLTDGSNAFPIRWEC
jgi:hypothetical protein